ncbi:MAG: hypothetical protein M1822_006870 [Bathelium mastoideum]|nr:MAG: hypothetical protein M1822_006870 [Bathelium mastoideum]
MRDSHNNIERFEMNLARAMACVALFDTGYLNLAPDNFRNIIAISAGDTLYVSEAFLDDPIDFCHGRFLRCFTGNVGKPGVALLMSPSNLVFREPELEKWRQVNHYDFEGQSQNSFQSTSLHISLTGYELALNTGAQGLRDEEVVYVEASVSIHEEGEWVGDIDILSLYKFNDILTAPPSHEFQQLIYEGWLREHVLPAQCAHSEGEKKDRSRWVKVVSIDSWIEYLDTPLKSCVIRAKGNWTARLAFAAAMRGREENALIAAGEICWACVHEVSQQLGLNEDQLVILW